MLAKLASNAAWLVRVWRRPFAGFSLVTALSGFGSGSSGETANATGVCGGDRRVRNDAEFDALVAERCQSIGGNLWISGISKRTFAGLEPLRSVGEGLVIVVESASLESLRGLEGLSTIGGGLQIISTAIPSIEGLEGVVSVGSPLEIMRNSALTSLRPLQDWSSDAVTGTIGIAENPLLPQCEVDAFDAAQLNGACYEGTCTGNDATAPCQ